MPRSSIKIALIVWTLVSVSPARAGYEYWLTLPATPSTPVTQPTHCRRSEVGPHKALVFTTGDMARIQYLNSPEFRHWLTRSQDEAFAIPTHFQIAERYRQTRQLLAEDIFSSRMRPAHRMTRDDNDRLYGQIRQLENQKWRLIRRLNALSLTWRASHALHQRPLWIREWRESAVRVSSFRMQVSETPFGGREYTRVQEQLRVAERHFRGLEDRLDREDRWGIQIARLLTQLPALQAQIQSLRDEASTFFSQELPRTSTEAARIAWAEQFFLEQYRRATVMRREAIERAPVVVPSPTPPADRDIFRGAVIREFPDVADPSAWWRIPWIAATLPFRDSNRRMIEHSVGASLEGLNEAAIQFESWVRPEPHVNPLPHPSVTVLPPAPTTRIPQETIQLRLPPSVEVEVVSAHSLADINEALARIQTGPAVQIAYVAFDGITASGPSALVNWDNIGYFGKWTQTTAMVPGGARSEDLRTFCLLQALPIVEVYGAPSPAPQDPNPVLDQCRQDDTMRLLATRATTAIADRIPGVPGTRGRVLMTSRGVPSAAATFDGIVHNHDTDEERRPVLQFLAGVPGVGRPEYVYEPYIAYHLWLGGRPPQSRSACARAALRPYDIAVDRCLRPRRILQSYYDNDSAIGSTVSYLRRELHPNASTQEEQLHRESRRCFDGNGGFNCSLTIRDDPQPQRYFWEKADEVREFHDHVCELGR